MKNLFEADRIEVDFNTSALLRKKLIADYGIVSGLEFSTPRQTSGELPDSDPNAEGSHAPSWAAPMAKQYAEAWFNDFESRLTTDLQQQFQSVRLAEDLAQRWPKKYKQLENAAKAIKADAKQARAGCSRREAKPAAARGIPCPGTRPGGGSAPPTCAACKQKWNSCPTNWPPIVRP